MRQFIIGAILLLAAAAQPKRAAAAPVNFARDVDEYLESSWEADGPGAAIIVVQNGKTIYLRGRGLANLTTRAPINADTVFRLGSITKQFTAATVLKLAEEGRLSLDDPIYRHLPSFSGPSGSATIRQLLNHTSGVPSPRIARTSAAEPHTTEQLIATFRDLSPKFPAGTGWEYSNGGYAVLGAIIEAVTGMPWHQEVRSRFGRRFAFQTLRSGVDEGGVPEMAKGYKATPQGPVPADPLHMSIPHAAGSLIASVKDLAAWNSALHGGQILGKSSYQAMTTPTILGGKPHPYGLGVRMGEVRNRRAIEHGGSISGYTSEGFYFPEQKLFIGLLSNLEGGGADTEVVVRRIAAIVLGDPYPSFAKANVDWSLLMPLFGAFGVGGEEELHFYGRDGRLFTRFSGGKEVEVFAAGNDRFFFGWNDLSWFKIRRMPDGANMLEMHMQGASPAVALRRTGPVPAT